MSERRKKAQMARKERRGRTTSNIFSVFTQQEIQEYKEAFNLIDQVNWYLLFTSFSKYNTHFKNRTMMVSLIMMIC